MDQADQNIKLNLGCGAVRPAGWVNADSSLNANIQKIPLVGKRIARLFNDVDYASNNVVYINLNRPWPYRDDSASVVYASHLFEHLSLKSAELFVNEAYRCLQPGGVIRIVVPDLYQIAKRYIAEYESNPADDPTTYIMWAINMHREGQYGSLGLFKRLFLEIQGYPHQHKYMYDAKSLAKRFSRFEDIQFLSYGVSHRIKDIADVEGTRELYLSVYLEGRKPG